MCPTYPGDPLYPCGHPPAEGIVWYGCAGVTNHAGRCSAPAYLFHLHTHVGPWCIYTFGDRMLAGWTAPAPIHGTNDSFVTYVRCPGLDEKGAHVSHGVSLHTEDEAQREHYEQVELYAAKLGVRLTLVPVGEVGG